jgi:hypothetical protein
MALLNKQRVKQYETTHPLVISHSYETWMKMANLKVIYTKHRVIFKSYGTNNHTT